jgi:hypothetical protein
MVLLLIVTVFFVWLINNKWEGPVETNNSYFANNPLIKKNRFQLGFRMNFSFMHLFQLSQFLRLIYILVKLIGLGNFSFLGIISNFGKIDSGLKTDSIV